MALVSSWQLYLDSLHGPLSKFHFNRLHLFRYSSYSSSSNNTIWKSRYIGRGKPSCGNDRKDSTLATSDWFPVWNKPVKDSRPKPPRAVLGYDDEEDGDGRGRTMERIVEKLRNSGYVVEGDGDERGGGGLARVVDKGSVEDIFYVEEDGMLPNSRGGFLKDSRLGVETLFENDREVRFPWEKPKEEEEQEGKWTARSKSRTFLAELTLPDSELKRLRNLTYQTKSRVKIKGAGITEEVVSTIRDKWKSSEIVRVKVDGAPALNMKKVHEILEKKTGGLVVWRSGTSIGLYRGVSYEVPSFHQNKKIFRRNEIAKSSVPADSINTFGGPTTVQEIRDPILDSENSAGEGSSTAIEKKQIKSHSEVVHYEDEIDKLLDGLGPRYMDWQGYEPLPVDADLLPGIVPGFQPPFRLLPYGVKPTLSQNDATSLRRLARVIPPHFALGRSRQLQGLAAAIAKLWEKSLIAKIALKRGVQITTSERMAEDLKKLTGGVLLVRTKEFLVYYRGKSFLSPDVTKALIEKERLAKDLQDEEEQVRLRASAFVMPNIETVDQPRTAGTLEETLEADSRWGKRLDDQHKEKIMREVEISKHSSLARKFAKKLAFAERRLKKAEDALAKVEVSLKPAEIQADPDSITDEERFMFRKLGLRMKAFLLVGRRGVFDGTVENMHLHWKYRELVKIVLKAKNFEFVKKTALALEAESGGVLVSVDQISKGYAIIVFRGKDYKRPSTIRPKTLLTKRKALARSIEIQRREALLKHISAVQAQVERLKTEMEELYGKLDSTDHMNDDENDNEDENEEEGYEVHLETYDTDDDDNDEDDSDNDDDEDDSGIDDDGIDVQDQKVKTEYEDGEARASIEIFSSHNDGDNELRSDTSSIENFRAQVPEANMTEGTA